MIKSVFSCEREIHNLTYEDILDYNFLQNLLRLIDEDEFIIDDNMGNENLINHIAYMLKQYLRKRNFDPSVLVDGLKAQLLQDAKSDDKDKKNVINNINMTLHYGADQPVTSEQDHRQG